MTTAADSLRLHLVAAMADDPGVVVWGQGVESDPTRIFGTLPPGDGKRLRETPNSEAAVAGMAIGAAMAGARPVVVFQRADFALLAMGAIINQAPKVAWLSQGRLRCPVVFRMMIGHGWGQGPCHGGSFESMFASVPGLKVVMPGRPEDMGPLLYASIMDDGPVVFLEHRWLHGMPAPDESVNRVRGLSVGPQLVLGPGKARLTIVGTGWMTQEAVRAAAVLAAEGIAVEVWDLSVLLPLNLNPIISSVAVTGRLLSVDSGPAPYGIGPTVAAVVAERAWRFLRAPPAGIGASFHPLPSSPALARAYYPGPRSIAVEALRILGTGLSAHGEAVLAGMEATPVDVPPAQPAFGGPF